MKNGASMASVQGGKTAIELPKSVNIRGIKTDVSPKRTDTRELFRKNIENGIKEKGPKVEKIFKKALEVAYDDNGTGWNRGKGLRMLKKPLTIFFDKILFNKIRENFGGRLEPFIGGGALLDIELQRFFYAIGIPMFQGYGLSESSPVISGKRSTKT